MASPIANKQPVQTARETANASTIEMNQPQQAAQQQQRLHRQQQAQLQAQPYLGGTVNFSI